MTVHFQGRTIETADAWDAMPLKKQMMAFHIIMSDMKNVIDTALEMPFKRHLLMQLLTDITDEELAELYALCMQEHAAHGHFIHAQILDDLYVCTDFFFVDTVTPSRDEATSIKGGQKAISPTLFACPFPAFTGEGDRPDLYCAGDAFNNINFYELTLLFDSYNQHTQSDNEDDVLEILALLYRPAKEPTAQNIASGYEGDIRQPILKHESMVEKRKPYMAWMPDSTRRFVLFWVGCCLNRIVAQHPQLFNRHKQTPANTRDYGWASVLLKLSGGVVHLDAVAEQPYENVLTYLNILEDERQEIELQTAQR